MQVDATLKTERRREHEESKKLGDKPTTSYEQTAFAWTELPRKYMDGGLISDRSNPFVVRATARVALAGGEYELLLRSKNVARLLVDGQVVIEQQQQLKKNADGHEETPDLPAAIRPEHRPPPPAHHELTVRQQANACEYSEVARHLDEPHRQHVQHDTRHDDFQPVVDQRAGAATVGSKCHDEGCQIER